MQLGAYTFAKLPSGMTMIKKDKFSSSVLTYSSVGYFSWGVTIVGKKLVLKWNYMTVAQYESLATIFEANTPVVFDPDDDSAITYNVEVTKFTGDYHIFVEVGATGYYRKNVELELLIMSVV